MDKLYKNLTLLSLGDNSARKLFKPMPWASRHRTASCCSSSSPANKMTDDEDQPAPARTTVARADGRKTRISHCSSRILVALFIILVCSILSHKTLPIQLASGQEVPSATTASTSPAVADRQQQQQRQRQQTLAASEQEADSNQVSELTKTTRIAASGPPAAQSRETSEQPRAVAAGQLVNENGQSAAIDDKQVRRRPKRHLGAESKAPDCHRLAAFWLFLQSQYPALSRHLLDWSTATSDQQSDEQFLWSRTSQIARTLGRLLDEAERLVAAEQQQQHHHHEPQPAHHSSAWLSRVSSKPAYARLLQHLRAKQHHQQHRTNEQPNDAAGTTATSADIKSAAQQQPQQQQQVSYGTLINYPHEIGDTSNSLGMQRTLEKLRLLNRHSKNLAEELERQQGGDSNSIFETNRIPVPIISDAELDGQSNWRRALELADEARSKVVYGNVILQPPKHNDNGQAQGHHNTLNKLHELATQEQPSSKDHEPPTTMDASGRINRVSTLSRLRQQLDDSGLQVQHKKQAADQFASYGGDAASSNQMVPADELINQQRSHQMSAFGGEQVYAGEDEFEGDFHTGPLQKAPEVRQLRSVLSKTKANDHKRGDNNEQQKQHKDSEVVIPKDGVFVVD